MKYEPYKMCFWYEKDFFKLINNSIYGKRIKKKMSPRQVNNAKYYGPYNNDFLG